MTHPAKPYGKKLLSLAMIFNSLLSIAYSVGLLTGRYVYNWRLYEPYLISELVFALLILASAINIFPSAIVGQVKTGRLWFHHYVYGFFISVAAVLYTAAYAPISLFGLFTSYSGEVSVGIGRFFVLGGVTLIVDDLPDVANVLKRTLCFLKLKAYQGRRILQVTQIAMSLVCIYLLSAIVLFMANNPADVTFGNIVLSANLFAAALISIGTVKQKIWLQKTVPKT